MIEYEKILRKNMLNVLKDILINISNNGLSHNNHLYITFLTNQKNNKLPNWIKQKYPNEMTIVIQYEYYNLEVKKDNFSITLSFNNVKTSLVIGFSSVISFADPSANFGLILNKNRNRNINKKHLEKNKSKKNNVINFSNYKKN